MTRHLPLLLLCIVPGCDGNGSPVAFDTSGGDAWTFQKLVRGHTAAGECDEVLIRSPRSEVRARVQSDHAFMARVPLRAGDNLLSAVCRRKGRDTGSAGVQRWNVRLLDRPRALARVRADGKEVILDGSATTVAPGIPAPLVRYEWRERKGNPAPLMSDPVGPELHVPAPATAGRYYITMRATDALGRSDETTVAFRYDGCRVAPIDADHEHPEWADTAVVYGVALPLFEPNAFQAVTSRIDAIAGIGATVLWLSPVTEAPPGDFGYAVTDPFALRSAFGSDAQFRELLAAAHAHSLHVILDGVTNQLSDQSRYFLDSRLHGRASPYYDWFARDAGGRPAHYFDWQNLENLNYDNPEVRSYVIAALSHWLEGYPADGFRIDAAWAMRQRAPRLWPEVRRELTRINPDVWLLAEASARDPYYADHGFDAAYDWTLTVGQWAWHAVFGGPSQPADLDALRAALSAGDAAPALRFINNNDTGQRFITVHGPGETRVAAALLFTLPGIPLIYNGDETGAAFEPYSAHQAPSQSDPNKLFEVYRHLAKLRRTLPALRSTHLTILHTNHDSQILAYARGEPADALVLLNFSAQPVNRVLLAERGRWRASDLLTGKALSGRSPLRALMLPGYSALLLQRPAAAAAISSCDCGSASGAPSLQSAGPRTALSRSLACGS